MRRIVSAILTLSLALSFVLAQSESASAAVAGYNSAYAGESVFLNKAAGETGQFSVIFTNTGTQGWFRNIVGLIACLDDKVTCNVAPEEAAYAVTWTSASVYASVSADTAAGQNGFFIYDFKVPAGTAGSTAAVFNGDVGLISTGALFNPQGYFHINTTPAAPPTGALTISPTSASVALGAQSSFTAGNVPTGATAAWSVTGGCGAVTQVGLFVATATNSATQPCSVVVSAGGLTASATLTVFGTTPTQITCSASPASTFATGSTTQDVTFSATLRDANGNVVSNASAPAITFGNNTPTTGAFVAGSPNPAAPVNGVATIKVTPTTTSGNIQVSASSGALTSCNIIVVSTAISTATKTAPTFSPTTIAADSVSTSRLRVDIQDANSLRVTSDNTTQVTATRDSASSTICSITGSTAGTAPTIAPGSGVLTAASGRVEFTVTASSTPGTCTMTITTNVTTIAGSSATLTTLIVGAVNKLAVSGNDTPKAAGAAATSTTTVTVDVQDVNGNRATASVLGIASALDADSCTGAGGGAVVTATAGATSQGRATFTYTSVGAYSACKVTYTAAGVTSTTTNMTFTAGSPDHLTCAFSPSPAILGDGGSTSTVTVRVRDGATATGNSVSTGGPFSVTLSRTIGTFSTLLTSNPQTTSGGIATFTVRSTTSFGTDTYTAAITAGSTPTLPLAFANGVCTISIQAALP